MERLNEILTLAQARARGMGLPYAGALTPQEAAEVWQLAPQAALVDVRTQAEWEWVGRIPGAVEIEWASYPGLQANPHFLQTLQRAVDSDALLMFICRSGARSSNAANVATNAGYAACYNVLEGFEGDKNANGQRNQVNGWRHAGLPWHQG